MPLFYNAQKLSSLTFVYLCTKFVMCSSVDFDDDCKETCLPVSDSRLAFRNRLRFVHESWMIFVVDSGWSVQPDDSSSIECTTLTTCAVSVTTVFSSLARTTRRWHWWVLSTLWKFGVNVNLFLGDTEENVSGCFSEFGCHCQCLNLFVSCSFCLYALM